MKTRVAAACLLALLASCGGYEPGYGKAPDGGVVSGVWRTHAGSRVMFIPYDACVPRHREMVNEWAGHESPEDAVLDDTILRALEKYVEDAQPLPGEEEGSDG